MTRLGRSLATAAVTLSLVAGMAPPVLAEEVDGVCDLEISINYGPLLDGTVEAYTFNRLVPVGRGFTPNASVHFTFTISGQGTVGYTQDADETGWLRGATYFWMTDLAAVGAEGTVTAEVVGSGEPCADAVTTRHLGYTPGGFSDLYFSRHVTEIVWLKDAGITRGCDPYGIAFCPWRRVIRDEMAAFIVRALDLPPTTEDFFDDDNGRSREPDINALGAAGIATGCGPRAFCPRSFITRAEMAAFLVRAFDLPPSDVNRFADDDGHMLESDINALAAAGITNGCDPDDTTLFCPSTFVTRESMALFLYRLLA